MENGADRWTDDDDVLDVCDEVRGEKSKAANLPVCAPNLWSWAVDGNLKHEIINIGGWN